MTWVLMGNVTDEACQAEPMTVMVVVRIRNCNQAMRRGGERNLEVIAVEGQGGGAMENEILNEDHPQLEVLRVWQTCAASAIWEGWRSSAQQTWCPVCGGWEHLGGEEVEVARNRVEMGQGMVRCGRRGRAMR